MKTTQPMSSFTRGTQIFMHAMRMIAQGIKIVMSTSLLITLLWVMWESSKRIKLKDLYHFMFERIATLKLYLCSFLYAPQNITLSVYDPDEHIFKIFNAIQYKNMVWQSANGQRLINFWNWLQHDALTHGFLIFVTSVGITYIMFVLYGKKNLFKTKNRGGELVSSKKLKFMLHLRRIASDITIADLPLVKDSERQHILITGTTGTGKTNLLHELIPQIRGRMEKAIIVDLNGTFIRSYLTEYDLILNPFDKRSVHWLPWVDCSQIYDYDSLAKALVGESIHRDPFWDNSATKIISEALNQFKTSKNLQQMLHILSVAPLYQYSDFFSNTPVAAITSKEGDKTTSSIRATINDKIKPLIYLGDDVKQKIFSLKNYINNKNALGWLFITAMPEQRNSLLPLIAAWLEILLGGLMQKEPSANNSNIWFIMDELPAFNKIPSLKTALAEARQYGGCIVAGMQNIHQLIQIYGYNEAQDLLDQFNTKFVFRVGEPKTAEITANLLGEQETTESKQSLSYGANSVRDGVNIDTIERRKQLVLPTEIMTLPNLTCYAKLAGNWPITKLKMQFHKLNPHAKRFIMQENYE